MNTHSNFEFLHAEGATPIKAWVRGVPLEDTGPRSSCRTSPRCRSSTRGSR